MGAGSQLSLLSAWGQCAVVRGCAVALLPMQMQVHLLPSLACCPLDAPASQPAALSALPATRSQARLCPAVHRHAAPGGAGVGGRVRPLRAPGAAPCAAAGRGTVHGLGGGGSRGGGRAVRDGSVIAQTGCARGSGPNFMHPFTLNPSDPSEHCIPFPRLLSSTQSLVLWRNLAFPARVACLLEVPHSQEGLPTDARSRRRTGGHSPAPVDPNSLFMVSMVAEQQSLLNRSACPP